MEDTNAETKKHCSFYMKKKNRYCNLAPKPGDTLCPTHKMGEKSDDRKRIPCPIDPRHTIFEDTLQSHISSKCPTLKEQLARESQPYFSKDINCGIPVENKETVTLSRNQQGIQLLKTITFDSLKHFLKRVDAAYTTFVPEISMKILQHPLCKESHQSLEKVKHDVQESSLVAHMEDLKLINSSFAYVEMGAGKGNLTHLVKQISQSKQSVLIDKQKCFRNKADRFEQNKSEFVRIGIDIKDLNLSQVKELKEKPTIVYSKHLCGQATDLTLRCVCNTGDLNSCKGIMIALCCHHKCAWEPYIDHEFFEKELKFSKEEFQYLCSMSSWAIDGSEQVKEEKEPATKKLKEGEISLDEVFAYQDLPVSLKKQFGFKAKRLIDCGRVRFLESKGFNVTLMKYVEETTTPENVLLIALPK